MPAPTASGAAGAETRAMASPAGIGTSAAGREHDGGAHMSGSGDAGVRVPGVERVMGREGES